jgi:hypothetical protein
VTPAVRAAATPAGASSNIARRGGRDANELGVRQIDLVSMTSVTWRVMMGFSPCGAGAAQKRGGWVSAHPRYRKRAAYG